MQNSGLPCARPCAPLQRRTRLVRVATHRSETIAAPPPPQFVRADQLPGLIESWLRSGQIDGHSLDTRANRAGILNRFVWFLQQEGITHCDADSIDRFLAYCSGSPNWPGYKRATPAKPRTVATYYRHRRAFFNYVVVTKRLVDVSPVAKRKIIDRADQVNPFSDEEIRALLDSAKRGTFPERDTAIMMLLWDSGLRVSELCSLNLEDVDLDGCAGRVEGRAEISVHKADGRELTIDTL